MRFSESHCFDCDTDTLLVMFTDRDYFVRKYELQGASNIEVLGHEDDGERFHIKLRRQVPQQTPFPGFIRKVVGESVTLVQSDTWWRSQGAGLLDIAVQGAPVTMVIKLRLTSDATGCRLALDFDVRAKVPVFGGKIEKFLGRDLVQRMHEDMAINERLLVEY